jgi:hypothetical protein
MPEKVGQAVQLLRHRLLHVMSGNAFVIGNGFVEDQGARGEIGSRHDDPAGVFAVRRADLVMSRPYGLEGGYGLNGDG